MSDDKVNLGVWIPKELRDEARELAQLVAPTISEGMALIISAGLTSLKALMGKELEDSIAARRALRQAQKRLR